MSTKTKKHLNIAIVCFSTYGGSGAVATELGIELAKRGHHIHFISNGILFRLGDWKRNITFHLVEEVDHPVLEQSSVYVVSLANKIAEVCRRYNIDIVHTHFAVPHVAAAILAKQLPGTKAKVINTFHGSDVNYFGDNLSLKETISYSLNACDGLTAVAEQLNQKAAEVYDVQRPIKTIYNWVEPKPVSASSAKELRELFAPPGVKIVTHISNFREVKRISDVMSIFVNLSKHVNARLLLIGDGPEQRIAHRLISRHKLFSKVHVLGIQTNVSRILSISDLFLLPSSSEAFSLAALEAMSYGVPVVTTRVGGMPEMITDGKNGYLAEVGDVSKMSTDAVAILKDPKLHESLSQQARQTIAKNFTADKIIPQYESYYDEVLSA